MVSISSSDLPLGSGISCKPLLIDMEVAGY